MQQYKYLIIGGGLAGDAAARGIRELDPQGSIALIGNEPDPPYTRPALSKGLWKGKPIESIWRNTGALGLEMLLNHTVSGLDAGRKVVRDEEGGEYGYEKALIATGGTPNRLPRGNGNVVYYRDLQDFRRLHEMTERRQKFLVIGGSFIGSEIAAALSMNGKKVTMVFRADGITARVLPADLSNFVNGYYREKGVEVLPKEEVTAVKGGGGHITAQTASGRQIQGDAVVAGLGITPNAELAAQAGIKVDDGIVVDEQLRTSAPDVYAAGDVANFLHAALGKHVRVEHEDNAIRMGKLAGRNMVGAGETYTHTPMFYSDLFDLGYEAVGELDSRLETFSDWQEPFKKGVVYYLEGGRVRGVLLWNVWKQLEAARALLLEAGPFSAANLRGRIA